MNIFNFIKNGTSSVFHYFKMIPVIYAINISLALLLAIPFFSSLQKDIGNSTVRDQLAVGFPTDWWSEFSIQADGRIDGTVRPTLSGGLAPLFDNVELLLTGAFNTFGIWILVFGCGYLLISTFLNGGVLGLFADEKKSFSIGRFFSFSGFYFHHFIAITLTSVMIFFLFYKFGISLVFGLIHALSAASASDLTLWLLNLLGYALLLLLFIIINIIFDYTKIILVVEKKDSAWLSAWEAMKFASLHAGPAFGLYGLLSLISVMVLLIIGWLITVLSSNQFLLVIIVVLLQQILILAKITLRLTFYGSQLALYQQGHSQERKLKKIKI
jgi:hypothetical protein